MIDSKAYYRLNKAAQLLGCTEGDLLDHAAAGEIVLVAFIKKATGSVKELFAPAPDFIARYAEALSGFPLPRITPGDPEPKSCDRFSGWAVPGDIELSELAMSGSVKEGRFDYLIASTVMPDKFHWCIAALRISGLPLMLSDLVVPASELARLASASDRPAQPATSNEAASGQIGYPTQAKPTTAPKTLNRQRAFAEQLGQLFGRAVSADDSREPMTIVMELLEGSKYAPLIKTPGSLYRSLDKAAYDRDGSELVVKVDAFAKWLRQKP
ncbi:MAG: hypothetical protein II007_11485 [Gammaproteobacteria bacterium]|nr:hypothetical protein [Gammaproteobacteria bacterium]